jgi:hypothetical protein
MGTLAKQVHQLAIQFIDLPAPIGDVHSFDFQASTFDTNTRDRTQSHAVLI